jgi:hypothetical protein
MTAAQTLGQIRRDFETSHPLVKVKCEIGVRGVHTWHAEWKTRNPTGIRVPKTYDNDKGFEFFRELENRILDHPPIEG